MTNGLWRFNAESFAQMKFMYQAHLQRNLVILLLADTDLVLKHTLPAYGGAEAG